MDASVTTPLLQGQPTSDDGLPTPAAYGQIQDHPSFLRACHSSWRCLPQNVICWIRGGVVAYLIAAGVMILDYKLREESPYSNWRILFDFSIVTWSLLLIYHLVVLGWTYTHFYHPHIDESRGGWEYRILRLVSLPYDMGSLRKQFYFTMFYTVTTIFTFMNTLIYWAVTLPHNDASDGEPSQPQPSGVSSEVTHLDNGQKLIPHEPCESSFSNRHGRILTAWLLVTEIFGEGWFKAFVILNLFIVSTVISLSEIFWLNSIKRPLAVGSHTLGVVFFAGLYLGWAAIGKIETGADAFYWLDRETIGSREAVVAASIGFVILAPIMYALMYGLVSMRESIARAAHSRRVAAAAAAAGN
ncbi:hypothetical protein CMUS01_02419 [Colletotrichum musicola]|uniref:Uncharacterized protein n=1 Tax=Colletotrichum musicola TaxID=2175873 RepID=A0A8H6NV66_9PEZI|nr:hypothetical protein CMUS01_02419 [Colletotrichum musicola]